MDAELEQLAQRIGEQLLARGWRLASAESCTGGLAAALITTVAGSSQWFDRGFVSYSNLAKQQMLGVSAATLERHGAVSEQTVAAMAAGALQHSQARVALAISGIAGPGGGTVDKPVGTVCLAWCAADHPGRTLTTHFTGDREAIRRQAVRAALDGVLILLEGLDRGHGG
ncbi:MAG: nicotinamide-nucleotide amidohydrolase family protein [Gammaproteobacteria bacterium]|nr:nicotinamide-nucleotide amidohydrolase family protein [Gammaproteobacteria bacterium]